MYSDVFFFEWLGFGFTVQQFCYQFDSLYFPQQMCQATLGDAQG